VGRSNVADVIDNNFQPIPKRLGPKSSRNPVIKAFPVSQQKEDLFVVRNGEEKMWMPG
jgi:hypothetical protein